MTSPAAADVPAPPARPSVLRTFVTVDGIGSRWPAAVRAAAAFALPASILLGAGLGRTALLAALGGFAVLYGENRPYRIRWRVILTAGLALVVSAGSLGALAHVAGATPSTAASLGLVAASVVLSALVVFVGNALRIGPPGPFFLVLTGGVALSVVQHGVSPLEVVAVTAAGVAGSLVVGMAPALVGRRAPEAAAVAAATTSVEAYLDAGASRSSHLRQGAGGALLQAWSVLHDGAQVDGPLARRLWEAHHRVHTGTDPDPGDPVAMAPLPRPSIARRLRSAIHVDSPAAVATVRVTVAATVAGVVSVLCGLSRPDWAIVAVVLVLQLGPDRIRGALRGAHRLVGTTAGVGLFALIHHLAPGPVVLVVLLAVLTFLIELAVVSNYGLAVMAITPLALSMSASGPAIATPALDRILETVIGVAVGIGALWVVAPRAHRRTTRFTRARALTAMARLLDVVSWAPVTSPTAMERRRDVQWSLMEAELAAGAAAVDEPAFARDDWPRHVRLRATVHELLGLCWRRGTAPSIDDDETRALRDAVADLSVDAVLSPSRGRG
ncbi:FUSC family protein [Williamsia serinedens]|uniref:Fusaric acid resistance protein-like n=1 Tax=Williamsia serinedens TaxID=391736 RepID=A0ABT1H8U3_9NOCA|nr:FUSC family protein [Williamsia serinedens]MCP2162337.1 Fusaric acid resistance protein-like [Williamsia serinedens]